MKVATFNVNSVRARLDILRRWLDEFPVDVLCLQETKVTDGDFPVDEVRSLGYEVACRGEKSYNGVAILSRHPMESTSCGFDGKGGDEGTRLITARVKGIDIVNTYIPQGTSPDSEKFAYKLEWFRRLRKYFTKRYSPDGSLLWMGDFNVAPEPIDVHDPKRLLGHVGYHPDEHRALEEVRSFGFIDIFRKHRPEPGHYSFWDYRVRDSVIRGLGWRVDHIWGTPAMADLSIDAFIDREPRLWERPSDHTPVVAVFSTPGTAK